MESSDSIEIRLANSLKALAVREPFEKITIKKITDGAGVIRVTFYNHFQDKYELLEWIMRTEILDPVRILMQNEMFREAIVLEHAERKGILYACGQDGRAEFICRNRGEKYRETAACHYHGAHGRTKGRTCLDDAGVYCKVLCQGNDICRPGMDRSGYDDAAGGSGDNV